MGDFKNPGRTWRPGGQPEPVRVHGFLIPTQGKAVPYGVYDLTRNAGWVSIGIDHDTTSFAVRTIGRWWQKMGRPPRLAHHRCRGQQRDPAPPVEVGTATVGHAHEPDYHHLPLPDRDEQVQHDWNYTIYPARRR